MTGSQADREPCRNTLRRASAWVFGHRDQERVPATHHGIADEGLALEAPVGLSLRRARARSQSWPGAEIGYRRLSKIERLQTS